jgi:hypothetical protein
MAKKRKDCATSIPQNSLVKGRQLDLFVRQGNLHKPQILSIPGISMKRRDRYRVMVGNEVLGEFLTIDKALPLAQGERVDSFFHSQETNTSKN